jgi:hypothetical protein
MKALRAKVLALVIRESDGHVLMEEITQAIAAYRAHSAPTEGMEEDEDSTNVVAATSSEDRRHALTQLKRAVVLSLWKFLDRLCQAHDADQQSKQRVYLLAKQIEELVGTHIEQRAMANMTTAGRGDQEPEDHDDALLPLPWHRIFQLVFDFLVVEHIEPVGTPLQDGITNDRDGDDEFKPKTTTTPPHVLLLPSSPLLATPLSSSTSSATWSNATPNGADLTSPHDKALSQQQRPFERLPPTPLVLEDQRTPIRPQAAAANRAAVAPAKLQLVDAGAAASADGRPSTDVQQEDDNIKAEAEAPEEELPGRAKAARPDRGALGRVDWAFLVEEVLDRETRKAAVRLDLDDIVSDVETHDLGQDASHRRAGAGQLRGVKRGRDVEHKLTTTDVSFDNGRDETNTEEEEEGALTREQTPQRHNREPSPVMKKRRHIVAEDTDDDAVKIQDDVSEARRPSTAASSSWTSRDLSIDSLLADLATERDEEQRLKQLLGM